MGPVITNQPNTQELVSCAKREKRKRKMCNTRQENPQQNQPWQGAYPDLSALNELFSPQAAVNSEQPSSQWIAFLRSLGLQPIPEGQQQATPAQEQPSAPPAPGTDGQTFAGTNSADWGQGLGQGYHQAPPGSPQSPPQPNGHSCGYSCGAPHISQLLQAITSRLLHFSSVATRASVTFFCIISFFCPCPPCWPATSSTPPSPSSTPSAPSSSSCPASTGCTCEASPLLIPQTGAFASLGQTWLGTNT